MRHNFRHSSIAVLAATATLFAVPAAAADFRAAGSAASPAETGITSAYQGWGWGGGGWGGGRRHRDRGVDVGDVLAGVLVIGAIAAIADAADDDSDNRRQRERNERDDREYRERFDTRTRTSANFQSSRGIDSAVAMCVDQVERGDERVESVDNAARTNDGWRVSGALQDGAGWNCWIDNDGRVREIDLATAQGAGGYVAASGSQLSDETYARARAAQQTGSTVSASAPGADEPRPAYPGGPLPGEEGYAESLAANTAT